MSMIIDSIIEIAVEAGETAKPNETDETGETAKPGDLILYQGNTADPYEFAGYIEAKYGSRLRCVIPKAGERIIF